MTTSKEKPITPDDQGEGSVREMADWQPIVTAPIDGTRILAAEPDGDGWIIAIAVFCKTPHVPIYGFHFTEGDPEDWDIAHPTHWMALPKAPSLSDQEAA